jgi:hypothetical protein
MGALLVYTSVQNNVTMVKKSTSVSKYSNTQLKAVLPQYDGKCNLALLAACMGVYPKVSGLS